MWNEPALYHTAFLHCIRCTNFMDKFLLFALVDFQHEYVEIVNSRLVSLTLRLNSYIAFMSQTNTDDVSDVKRCNAGVGLPLVVCQWMIQTRLALMTLYISICNNVVCSESISC